jgi:hypothetical protein
MTVPQLTRKPRGATRKPGPRGQLHPAFIAAVRRDRRSRNAQALLAGFPNTSILSSYLTAERIALTPQALSRLADLALLIGYPFNEMFIEEVQL